MEVKVREGIPPGCSGPLYYVDAGHQYAQTSVRIPELLLFPFRWSERTSAGNSRISISYVILWLSVSPQLGSSDSFLCLRWSRGLEEIICVFKLTSTTSSPLTALIDTTRNGYKDPSFLRMGTRTTSTLVKTQAQKPGQRAVCTLKMLGAACKAEEMPVVLNNKHASMSASLSTLENRKSLLLIIARMDFSISILSLGLCWYVGTCNKKKITLTLRGKITE